jgi:hypothetical protein
MAQDLLLSKVQEFTSIEDVTLEAWIQAAEAGDAALSHDILNGGLLAEHYRSLLDADPSAWTADQGSTYAGLLQNLDNLLHRLASAHGTNYLGGQLPAAPAPPVKNV